MGPARGDTVDRGVSGGSDGPDAASASRKPPAGKPPRFPYPGPGGRADGRDRVRNRHDRHQPLRHAIVQHRRTDPATHPAGPFDICLGQAGDGEHVFLRQVVSQGGAGGIPAQGDVVAGVSDRHGRRGSPGQDRTGRHQCFHSDHAESHLGFFSHGAARGRG